MIFLKRQNYRDWEQMTGYQKLSGGGYDHKAVIQHRGGFWSDETVCILTVAVVTSIYLCVIIHRNVYLPKKIPWVYTFKLIHKQIHSHNLFFQKANQITIIQRWIICILLNFAFKFLIMLTGIFVYGSLANIGKNLKKNF